MSALSKMYDNLTDQEAEREVCVDPDCGRSGYHYVIEDRRALCSGRHHLEWVAYAGGTTSTSVWGCIHCPTEALIDTIHKDDSAFMVCEHSTCVTRRAQFGIES